MDVEYVGPIMDERFWLATLAETEKVNPYVLLVRVRLLPSTESSPSLSECLPSGPVGVTSTMLNDHDTYKNFNGASNSCNVDLKNNNNNQFQQNQQMQGQHQQLQQMQGQQFQGQQLQQNQIQNQQIQGQQFQQNQIQNQQLQEQNNQNQHEKNQQIQNQQQNMQMIKNQSQIQVQNHDTHNPSQKDQIQPSQIHNSSHLHNQFHYLLIRNPMLVQRDVGILKHGLSSLTHIPHDRMKLSYANIPSSHLLFEQNFQMPLLRTLFGAVIYCEEMPSIQRHGFDGEEIRALQNALRSLPVPEECQPSLRGVLNVLTMIPFRMFSHFPKNNVSSFKLRYRSLNLEELGLPPHHNSHQPSTSIQFQQLPHDILCIIIGSLISGKSFDVCIRRFGLVCQEFFDLICSQHQIISTFGFSGEFVSMMMPRLANATAKELNLAYAPIRIEAILDSVVKLKSLERLYLSGQVFSDATGTLNELTKNLPKLKVLWLNKTNVTADSVAIALKNCPSLRIDCSYSCISSVDCARFGGQVQATNCMAPAEDDFEFLAELPLDLRSIRAQRPELKSLPAHLVENAIWRRRAEIATMSVLCNYYWKGNLSPECIAYAFSYGDWPIPIWNYVFSSCGSLPKELLLWCLNEVLADRSGIFGVNTRLRNDAFSALIRSPACHEEFPWEIIADSHHRYCFAKRVINEGFPLPLIPHDLLLQIIDHSSIRLNAVQEEQLCIAFLQHYQEKDCQVLDEQLSEELIRKSLRFPNLVSNLLKSGIKLTMSPPYHVILYMAEFAHTSKILTALIDYNVINVKQIPAEVGTKALMQRNYDFFKTLCDLGWPTYNIHQIYPAELYTQMAVVSLLERYRYPFWLILRQPICQDHRIQILRSAPLDVRYFFQRLRLFSDDDQKAALTPLVAIPYYPNLAHAIQLSEPKKYSAGNPANLIKHGKCMEDLFDGANVQRHSVTELDDDMPMRPLKRQRIDLGQAFKTT